MKKYSRARLEAAIRACEKMEAGRELDAAIANTIHPKTDGGVWIAEDDEWQNGRYDELAPVYTSHPYDLTAAMGLVPEGWKMLVDFHSNIATAEVHNIRDSDKFYGDSAAGTPSHALTLAALRAQLSLIEE